MYKVIFNRRDEKVKQDAVSLSLQDFIEQYKEQTTTSVLTSVHKDYNKGRAIQAVIEKKVEESVDFPTAQLLIEEEEKETKTKPIVKVKEVKKETIVKTKASKENELPVFGRKDLRAAIAKVGKDKGKVKEELIAQGFSVTVKLHSEWNNV